MIASEMLCRRVGHGSTFRFGSLMDSGDSPKRRTQMRRCRAIAIIVATTLGVLLAGLHPETLFAQFPAPVPDFAAPLTPEQFAAGNEFLDELGGMFWSLANGILVIEEPEEMVGVDQSELNEMVEGHFQELRPRIKAQLLFLKKTGNLSDEQFQTISECGEYEAKEALRKHLADVERSQRGDRHGDDVDLFEATPLPQVIQKALAEFVITQISADQLRQSEAECTLRGAHRKRVTILNVVARLDADLLLLPEQREQFSKLIEAEWRDSWGQSLSALMPDSNFIPALPDDKVLAILKDYQQAVWKAQHYNRESTGWDDDPLGLLQEDDEAEAEPDEMKADEGEAEPLANRD
jgi:hypothetical protein